MAVAESYLAPSEDKLKDVATFIREVILKAFKSSKEMPWSPITDDIEKMLTEKLPEELERFLNLIFSENEPNTEKCERIKRFVYSIGQVVCRDKHIADTYLTPQIVTGKDNLVFHSEWGNLNKILTNVTGPNVVNSEAGIMLQEQKRKATFSAKQPRPMLGRSKG